MNTSAGNIEWLSRAIEDEWREVAASLDAFWDVYVENPVYRSLAPDGGSRRLLAERCMVRQGSVFDLQPDAGDRFDVGTMFFVAESVSGQEEEFSLAVKHFLGILEPRAPFAAAFMAGSQGYEVDGVAYPATSVAEADIRDVLEGFGAEVLTLDIPVDEDPLRSGYDGMVVAVGRTAG